MPDVDPETIAAECSAIVGTGHTRRCWVVAVNIAEAVRPGVIGRRRHAVAQPLLDGKIQTFIAGRAAVIDLPNTRVILPLRRVQEIQDTPGLLICCRGALVAGGDGVGDDYAVRQSTARRTIEEVL